MTAVNGWASPRDEFPDSVRTLMSLWGGFATTPANDDFGLEKRLEIDFVNTVLQCPNVESTVPLNVMQLVDVISGELDEQCEKYQIEHDVFTVTFRQCLLVRYCHKLIITSMSTIMLHRLIQPLLHLLDKEDIEVEWASYFRKNISSPWSTTSSVCDVMAQEYADLKAAFPNGESFLTGPVDGDNFYHFVFDRIQRAGQRMECDAQLNVFMFNVEPIEDTYDESEGNDKKMVDDNDGICASCDKSKGKRDDIVDCSIVEEFDDVDGIQLHRAQRDKQYLSLHPDGTYEMLRCYASLPNVSYENNFATNEKQWKQVSELIDKYKPARFTVVVLQDRDDNGHEIRTCTNMFAHYNLQSRMVNEFAYGYKFHQMLFTREI